MAVSEGLEYIDLCGPERAVLHDEHLVRQQRLMDNAVERPAEVGRVRPRMHGDEH